MYAKQREGMWSREHAFTFHGHLLWMGEAHWSQWFVVRIGYMDSGPLEYIFTKYGINLWNLRVTDNNIFRGFHTLFVYVVHLKNYYGIILVLSSANERRRYNVTSSLTDLAHNHNDAYSRNFVLCLLVVW